MTRYLLCCLGVLALTVPSRAGELDNEQSPANSAKAAPRASVPAPATLASGAELDKEAPQQSCRFRGCGFGGGFGGGYGCYRPCYSCYRPCGYGGFGGCGFGGYGGFGGFGGSCGYGGFGGYSGSYVGVGFGGFGRW